MNTIIIWDSWGDEPIQFAVVEGDFFHLDRTYIGATSLAPEKEEELERLIFTPGGEYTLHMSREFPFDAYSPGNTRVIVAGMLP